MKKAIVLLMILMLSITIVNAAGSGGGGGGGGGGGNGGSSSDAPVFRFSNSDSIEKTLEVNKDYKIVVRGIKKYTFKIKKIENEIVTFAIKTEPTKEFLVSVGESKEIDLEDDGSNDLIFNVISISGNEVDVIFKKIMETSLNEDNELLCGDRNTRRERVRCRLNLESDELEEEYQLEYLPEECKALERDRRDRCINIYRNAQSCWRFNRNAERVSCVQNQLNFRGVSEERRQCNLLTGEEKRACVEDFKEKLFTIIKFRFYNLEERAEEFLEEGKTSEEDVVNFIDAVEGKKAEFNEASLERKKAIVMEVKELWLDFKTKVN